MIKFSLHEYPDTIKMWDTKTNSWMFSFSAYMLQSKVYQVYRDLHDMVWKSTFTNKKAQVIALTIRLQWQFFFSFFFNFFLQLFLNISLSVRLTLKYCSDTNLYLAANPDCIARHYIKKVANIIKGV